MLVSIGEGLTPYVHCM